MKPGTIAVPVPGRGVYLVVAHADEHEVVFNRIVPPEFRAHPTDNGVSTERVRPLTFARRYEIISEPS